MKRLTKKAEIVQRERKLEIDTPREYLGFWEELEQQAMSKIMEKTYGAYEKAMNKVNSVREQVNRGIKLAIERRKLEHEHGGLSNWETLEDEKMNTALLKEKVEQASLTKQIEAIHKVPSQPKLPEQVMKEALETIKNRVEFAATSIADVQEMRNQYADEWTEKYGREKTETLLQQFDQQMAQFLLRGL